MVWDFCGHVLHFHVWYYIKTKKIDVVLIPYSVLLFLSGETSEISLQFAQRNDQKTSQVTIFNNRFSMMLNAVICTSLLTPGPCACSCCGYQVHEWNYIAFGSNQ